jgi:hypothetical protein
VKIARDAQGKPLILQQIIFSVYQILTCDPHQEGSPRNSP